MCSQVDALIDIYTQLLIAQRVNGLRRVADAINEHRRECRECRENGMTWYPIEQSPPSPGSYWTRNVTLVETLPHGLVRTTYTQDWLVWDGTNWSGELTDWYMEAHG